MGSSQGKQPPFWKESEFVEEQHGGSELLDKILDPYRALLKDDFIRYRNHCQRVYQFALYLMPKPSDTNDFKKLAIALAHHDLGIWTDNTVDYIDPSRSLAVEYLESNNLSHWKAEVDAMVEKHHQILQGTLKDDSLVEVVRKADLVDFSMGWVKNGLPKQIVNKVLGSYENAGFHYRLVQLALAWFIRHPTNPAPMMKWSS